MKVHITGDNPIPSEKSSNINKDSLKNIFSDGIPKSEDPKPKKNKFSDSIKDKNWEQVKSSKKSIDFMSDMKSIKPSRTHGDSDIGGPGFSKNLKESIMSNSSNSPKNKEFTKHIISEGNKLKNDKQKKNVLLEESKKQWEIVSKAKTTENLQVKDRGVTPNRSSVKIPDLPKFKIDLFDKIKENNEKSAEAGKKAFDIKRQLDLISKSKKESISDKWEDDALKKINKSVSSKVKEPVEKIKFSKNEINKPIKTDLNLNGLFDFNKEIKEEKITRNSDHLKQQREKREDDRSWEKVVKNKKR